MKNKEILLKTTNVNTDGWHIFIFKINHINKVISCTHWNGIQQTKLDHKKWVKGNWFVKSDFNFAQIDNIHNFDLSIKDINDNFFNEYSFLINYKK